MSESYPGLYVLAYLHAALLVVLLQVLWQCLVHVDREDVLVRIMEQQPLWSIAALRLPKHLNLQKLVERLQPIMPSVQAKWHKCEMFTGSCSMRQAVIQYTQACGSALLHYEHGFLACSLLIT